MTQGDLFVEETDEEPVLTVSELTAQITELLEGSFPAVWLTGEISNLARPRSGHCYLTLKDEAAQIRAVMWRGVASRVPFDLQDGLEVVCQGYLDVYAPRGSYQLVVQQIQPKGIGPLELALRQLRAKLSAEGLFDPVHKQPLPRFPRRVAVVTSPTSAAVHDFLQVLLRRWRGTEVLIVPVRVQGDSAAGEIAAAIEEVNRYRLPVDCLVVTRGGGSLEDLWAFNEEIVVRAIHASRIPVVSAVGHEIDVTLSDMVADVRALTPSEAAERIVPVTEEVRAMLSHQAHRLTATLRGRAAAARSRLDGLAARRVFRRPLEVVHQLSQRLDDWSQRSSRAVTVRLSQSRGRADELSARLESLSPLAVLRRGYSVTRRGADERLLRDAAELKVGDELITQFAQGVAHSRVERVDEAGTGKRPEQTSGEVS